MTTDREPAGVAPEATPAANERDFRTKFLASLAHALRTPLSTVIGFSELLEQELFGGLTARQREYVGNVLISGRQLLQVVNELADVSRLEAGQLQLVREWTPLMVVLEAARVTVEPLLEKRRVRLSWTVPSEPPQLFVDPIRLRQALHSCLARAVLKTTFGGEVRLELQVEDERVRVVIADSGVELSADELARLFRPFDQLTPEAIGRPEEAGLGLFLAKRLIELHGGAVTVDSRPGRGTAFTLQLPRAVREIPAAAAPSRLVGRRVLLVSSDGGEFETIAALLEELGCRVERVAALKAELSAEGVAAGGVEVAILDLTHESRATVARAAAHAAQAIAASLGHPLPVIGVVESGDDKLAVELEQMSLVEALTRESLRSALVRALERNPRPLVMFDERTGLPDGEALLAHVTGALARADRECPRVAVLVARVGRTTKTPPSGWAQYLQPHLLVADFVAAPNADQIVLVTCGRAGGGASIADGFAELLRSALGLEVRGVEVAWYPVDRRHAEHLLASVLASAVEESR